MVRKKQLNREHYQPVEQLAQTTLSHRSSIRWTIRANTKSKDNISFRFFGFITQLRGSI